MFQEFNGDLIPELECLSEDYWKVRFPSLFPNSSSELEDDQEQVGLSNKVKRRHSFDMSFVFEIHFSSLLVVVINALYKIYLAKVILQLSVVIASEGLFSVPWSLDMCLAFKVTGTVVLLISVAGRQSQCLFRCVLSD